MPAAPFRPSLHGIGTIGSQSSLPCHALPPQARLSSATVLRECRSRAPTLGRQQGTQDAGHTGYHGDSAAVLRAHILGPGIAQVIHLETDWSQRVGLALLPCGQFAHQFDKTAVATGNQSAALADAQGVARIHDLHVTRSWQSPAAHFPGAW